MNFEVFLILKTTHGFTMSPIVNILKIPPSTFEQSKFSVSTSPNKFWIYFQLFLSLKSFLPIILSLSDFQSKYLIAFEFLSQTNSHG